MSLLKLFMYTFDVFIYIAYYFYTLIFNNLKLFTIVWCGVPLPFAGG